MKKITLLSLTASVLLANIAEYNFYYQDYMDFGQNKGRFTPGVTNITIIGKNGNTYNFGDLPMPDFVGPTDPNGIMTFVGGSYVFTASHTRSAQPTMLDRTYNQVAYNEIPFKKGDDSSFVRYDKFITSLVMPQGFLPGNADDIPFKKNKERYTHFWRSGQGAARARLEGQTNGTEIGGPGVRTGGILLFKGEVTSNRVYVMRGFMEEGGIPLANTVTGGDSGSPIWIWDNVERKWLLGGATSRGDDYQNSQYAFFQPHLFKELIKNSTNPVIQLNSLQASWSAENIKLDSQSNDTQAKNAQKDKDIVLQGGGAVTLTQNIDQGSGGIYFLADKAKTQTDYTIASNMGGGGYIFLEGCRTAYR